MRVLIMSFLTVFFFFVLLAVILTPYLIPKDVYYKSRSLEMGTTEIIRSKDTVYSQGDSVWVDKEGIINNNADYAMKHVILEILK